MQKETWNLKDILPEINSKEYKILLEELEKATKYIESYRNKINPNIDIKDFMSVIKAKEKIAEITSRLCDYAYLWFSQDTSNQEAKNYRSLTEQLLVNISNRIMFFSLWFKDLDEKNANKIIEKVPSEYKYMLKYLRILKPHTLTEKEEKIINLKETTGSNALIKLYDMVTTNFTFKLRIRNKNLELTREELTGYVKNNDPKVRKAAYQSLYKVYSEHSDILNEIYRNLILDWKNENLGLRKFSKPITPRNISNDVSYKSINSLLEVTKKNKGLFQEYFKLKAKICKIKNMSRYDIYTQYKTKDKKHSYEESKKLVLVAYKSYSEEMYNYAKKMFDLKHIEPLARKNKMSGAYCMMITPKIEPYVLLNHTGDLRDVFTMAHELGHSIHDQLASNHSILTAHPPLILAETASVFGEMILFENLMKSTKEKEIKKMILIQQLDNIYATILRQTYFILYEIKAHEMIAKGTTLEELNKTYLENLKEQFGNSLVIPKEFKYEWITIPHIFHTPFYCYAYSFGNLLVLALYEKYRKEGKSFVTKYLKILSYGGSENPSKILKEVGIDIESEDFWQSGFNLVKEMINDLKKL